MHHFLRAIRLRLFIVKAIFLALSSYSLAGVGGSGGAGGVAGNGGNTDPVRYYRYILSSYYIYLPNCIEFKKLPPWVKTESCYYLAHPDEYSSNLLLTDHHVFLYNNCCNP
jgi:hypothetical protein